MIAELKAQKAQADKVIARLESDIAIKDNLNKLCLNALRHNKRKRCMAMARWCGSEVFVSDYEKDELRMRWFIKWHKRWLELAEKFKEENK